MLKINEYEIAEITDYMGRSSRNVKNTYNEVNNSFSVLNRSGLFSSGIDNIKAGINKLSSNIDSLKNIVTRESEKMKEAENALSNVAEQIEIPNFFVVDNSMNSHETADITLQKDDGRSVNEGANTEQEEMKLESSVEHINNLSNVSNDTMVTEHKLNEYTTKNNDLNNINNGRTTEEQIYDDSSVVKKETLSSIEKNNGINMQEYNNDYYSIEKERLKNINDKVGEKYES